MSKTRVDHSGSTMCFTRTLPGSHFRTAPMAFCRRAFTLVELLVVVAIIALLIAILLPSLRSAREQARRAKCLSNLQNITRAVLHYIDDNNGRFPTRRTNMHYNYGGVQGLTPLFSQGDHPPLPKPINRYLNLEPVVWIEQNGVRSALGSAEVFRCPSDDGSPEAAPSNFEAFGTSYCTNEFLIGGDIRVDSDDPAGNVIYQVIFELSSLRYSSVTLPLSQMLLLGDGGWLQSAARSPFVRAYGWHGSLRRHNLAFMDGHAEYLRVRKGLWAQLPEFSRIPFNPLALRAFDVQQEVAADE